MYLVPHENHRNRYVLLLFVGPAVRQDAPRQGGLRGHQVFHPPADGHEEGVREELHPSQEDEQRMMLKFLVFMILYDFQSHLISRIQIVS